MKDEDEAEARVEINVLERLRALVRNDEAAKFTKKFPSLSLSSTTSSIQPRHILQYNPKLIHNYSSQSQIMASGKRAASGDFDNSQMVLKKANVGGNSKAVAVVNGTAANGALIQTVCSTPKLVKSGARFDALMMATNRRGIGAANNGSAGSCDGIEWSFWGGLLCQVRPEWKLHCVWIYGPNH